jgi:hypothetical protein
MAQVHHWHIVVTAARDKLAGFKAHLRMGDEIVSVDDVYVPNRPFVQNKPASFVNLWSPVFPAIPTLPYPVQFCRLVGGMHPDDVHARITAKKRCKLVCVHVARLAEAACGTPPVAVQKLCSPLWRHTCLRMG